MDKQAELDKLEARAFAVRIPIYKLCGMAGVAPSTVSRWRAQPDTMRVSTLRKLEQKLDELEGV